MDLNKRASPSTLIVIAALHLGLLLLVLIKPKLPSIGNATYMELRPVLLYQAKPLPSTGAKPSPRQNIVARRQPAKPADTVAGAISTPAAEPVPAETVLESAAPDFAAAPKSLDLDQLRKQAAKNDQDFKTPLDKVREQERRKKSIETVVAAAAKAGARKDCQNGYAGFGILAIIPILYGTVTDNGCKWK